MVDAFSTAFSDVLLRMSLPVVSSCLLFVGLRGASLALQCASRRIRRVCGIVTLMFLGLWVLAMGSSGSPPTREEKEQNRALQEEIAAERAAIGSLLLAGNSPRQLSGDGQMLPILSWEHGVYEEGARIVFPNGWVFPFCANHLSSVEVMAWGEVLPDSRSHEQIAAFGSRLSLVPGVSSFHYGMTSSNSCAFVWSSARYGRINGDPFDGRIELFRNGDVSVSTNGVAALLPRELPFPHDGLGQDDEWVTANFTNATEILAVDYPQWIDAQVGEGLTNGLYKFTATISDDPPETVQLVVGDLSVAVTNAGEYVFLLEKGMDYEYGIIPFMTNVSYSAVDDVPQTRGVVRGGMRSSSGDAMRTWTVAGGYGNEPQTEYALGRVWWLPFFFGSPDVSHIGPENDAQTFTANFADCRQLPVASYLWTASDGLTVHSPNAQTTQITVDSMPSWAQASVSVAATIGDHELNSYLDGLTYGTNDTPQVSLGINAPQAMFVNDDGDVAGVGKDYEISGIHVNDDDIIPVTITLHSDVPTNGTIAVRPFIRDGHLWKDASRTNEVILEELISVSESRDVSIAYFLECEYQSYRYNSDQIQVVWSDNAGHTQQIVHQFTAVDCIAEPITSERVTVGGVQYVVNPCCAIIGSNTFMRVRVAPNDIPNDLISWRVVQGTASFPNGNTGRDVVVVAGGEENDTVILEVDIAGCPGNRPRFELLTTHFTDVLIYPYLIVGAPGAELLQEQLNQKLEVVNMIYRQVGLRFIAAPIQIIDNYKWSKFGLAVRAVGRAIRDYEHKTDGVEVYFIGGSADIVDYDCKALGRANSDGVVIACNASGIALAHEIGHVCRLADVYIDKECQEQYSPLRITWMPDDWSNGTGSRYYEPGKCPLDVLPQILMFGVENDVHIDIPRGSVRGMVNDKTSSTGKSLGQGAVGRNTMLVYPPHTK